MIKTKLENDKSGRNGNPFIYHEGHEANRENKNGHRFKNLFHHEGHEGKRRLLFTLDSKINFSEKIDFFVSLRALRGQDLLGVGCKPSWSSCPPW